MPEKTRVGSLRQTLQVLRPSMSIDPATGGLIAGPPVAVATVAGSVVPGPLAPLQERLSVDGQIVNVNTFIVTVRHCAALAESVLLEFWDQAGQRMRRLEVSALRDLDHEGCYQEALCRERAV